MLFSTPSLAILAAAIPYSLAQVTTSTTVRTYTSYTNTPVATIQSTIVSKTLPTTTITTTSHTTTNDTLQFTTTVPIIFFSTTNVTSTFEATTNVFTSNYTNIARETVNSTVTSYINATATVGNTVYTSTVVTIPTSSGFVPVDDSANNYNYNKTMKRGAGGPRHVVLLPRQVVSTSATATPATSYIYFISISTRFQPRTTSTLIVTSTKTTKVKPTTVTAATTSIVTSIVGVPDQPVNSTTTFTFNTTQTVYQNITVQSQKTVTTITTTVVNNNTAISTSYAACATNNLLGPRLSGGNYINAVFDLNTNNLGQGTHATSAYDCCTICQDETDCDFSVFNGAANGTLSQCTLFSSNTATCSHKEEGYFNVNKNVHNVVVSNGPCGQLGQGKPASA